MQMCKQSSARPKKKHWILADCWGELHSTGAASLLKRVSDCNKLYPYWESMKAKKLFKTVDDEVDALDAINNQMELL
jgi:hypothetical protein